jgi:hypothetical protein
MNKEPKLELPVFMVDICGIESVSTIYASRDLGKTILVYNEFLQSIPRIQKDFRNLLEIELNKLPTDQFKQLINLVNSPEGMSSEEMGFFIDTRSNIGIAAIEALENIPFWKDNPLIYPLKGVCYGDNLGLFSMCGFKVTQIKYTELGLSCSPTNFSEVLQEICKVYKNTPEN